LDINQSGRIAKVCREHRRVLERADHGEGLMCPGPDGWHLVDDYLSIDRHTGHEVKQVDDVDKEEESVPKRVIGNACPKCGRPKKGRNARDGKPCGDCRAGKKTARPAASAASSAVPVVSPTASPAKKRTLEMARFEDRARTLTLSLVQRPAPKTGGPSFLVRWRIAAAKGAPGRKAKPTVGVSATAMTEQLARKEWLSTLHKAGVEGWTKVEATAKRGRELHIEMFPAAIGKPKRAA
jgi:hypothetical protein